MIGARAFVALAALGLGSGLAACGYTEIHEVVLRSPGARTAHPPSIEVYMYGQPAPRPFFELALLQVVGHGSDANLADLVKGMTARAAQLGCDAVIRVQIDQGYSMAHAFGVCVRWTGSLPGEGAPAPSPRPQLIPTPDPGPTLAPVPEPPAERAPTPAAPSPPAVTPGGTSL